MFSSEVHNPRLFSKVLVVVVVMERGVCSFRVGRANQGASPRIPLSKAEPQKRGDWGGGGLGGAWVTRGTRRLLAVGEKFLSATGSRLPDGATVLGDGLR